LDARDAYAELLRRFQERALLLSSKAVLEWDEETHLPARGVAYRGHQLAQLAGLAHDLLVHPGVAEALAAVASSPLVRDPLSPEATNVREWGRLVARHARLERALVEETARRVSLAQPAWADARDASDFARFAPHLERVLEVKRLEAQALSSAAPYDALLDEYSPGMTAARLRELFEPLDAALRALLDRVRGASRRPRLDLLRRPVALSAQRELSERVARALGYDFDAGGLDLSAHPFSAHLGPHDVRITARFSESGWSEGLLGVLHEVGHALYDQGLPPEHFGLPRGEPISSAVHESQSRLWENRVGRALPTWRWLLPLLRDAAAGAFADAAAEDVWFALNAVVPGARRVPADEATYDLHVFVRFDLEQALLTRELPVKDLPGAWNEAYARTLGVRPASDAEGCLQDGHWGAGILGYFPSYSLGNLMAAQLFGAALRELGSQDAAFARGDFDALRAWLAARVWARGHQLGADDLLVAATGAPLRTDAFLAALRAKCEALYGL
jgi:carboxypeptidase Taq